MRILYGVVGEGMGHAMRSRVLLEHLVGTEAHEVAIMTSGRAADVLAKRFAGVTRIHGLHMIYEDNRVRLGDTLWSNIAKGVSGVPQNIAAYYDLIGSFEPEVVISDFESWTYLYGQNHRLPVLSIDNMQIINRARHSDEILDGHRAEFEVTRAFIKAKLPFCDEYFITTFFRPELRKERTRLVPPILRPEILEARRRDGDHLLVYTTAQGDDAFARALGATGLECRIYGMRRDLSAEIVEGNLRYRPFSEATFIEDLASCKGVVAGGGFTLMGEAVYLQKPMLAVPLARQFEQVLNARYLEKLGYGRSAATLDDPATIHAFVESIPVCAARLASYSQDGNREVLAAVDEFLDKAAAGIT